jgi:transcriptional regulator with AAA-type ATPase domain
LPQTLAQTQKDDLSGAPPTGDPEPALYVVLEGMRPLAGGMRVSLEKIREVRFHRGDARKWSVEDGIATLEIPDQRMSSKHARLTIGGENAEGGFLVEDLGSTNGTFVDGKRVPSLAIDDATIVTLGATCFLVDPQEIVPDGALPIVDAPSLASRPLGMATLVPMIEQPMPRLVRVAMSKLSILLLGESGVGKEVLARAIHKLSGRTGPFVAINCGALAPNLVESQLFGYTKGAFSGAAKDEPGLVRASSGGTLFLDEIGELPPTAQATLLRVLQEHEVLPVGATKPVTVDLRVVAATLKPIEGTETFRADLYARVAAFLHRIPSLRERMGDIGLLVAALLKKAAPERADKLKLAPELATALVTHDWPLNVRELEHVLSVAAVTSGDDLLRLEHVGSALKLARPSEQPAKPSAPMRVTRPLTDEENRLKDELTRALTKAKGNVSEVSRTLGKTRMQLHRWMKRFSIDPDSFRG